MHYKLLVIDIDGTLVGKEGYISKENRQAIARALDSGLVISLCTGRSITGCLPLLEELGLDGYHVFYDGALVTSPSDSREIYIQEMAIPGLRKAIEWSFIRGLEIELYSSKEYFAEHENWSTQTHRKYFNTVPRFVRYFDLLGKERIIKIGAVATNRGELDKINEFCRDFRDIFHYSWVTSPAFPGVEFINIVSPDVSKGKAVTVLAEHLGISKEEIVAVGDGENDVSMLSVSGLGIAMHNSPPELKQAADYVTLDVEENGLAEAIEKFILI